LRTAKKVLGHPYSSFSLVVIEFSNSIIHNVRLMGLENILQLKNIFKKLSKRNGYSAQT